MVKYTKFEVEIGTNNHIKLDGVLIAVLGQWNQYEDLIVKELYNSTKNSSQREGGIG